MLTLLSGIGIALRDSRGQRFGADGGGGIGRAAGGGAAGINHSGGRRRGRLRGNGVGVRGAGGATD